MSNLKIAVFANCCRIQSNRGIYQRMARDGWDVRIYVQADHHVALEPDTAGIVVTPLARYGTKSRFFIYQKLNQVLQEFGPDQVLLDLEPDSLLACQLGHWCSRNHKSFYVQTCENQSIWATTVCLSWPARCVTTLIRRLLLCYTIPRINHVFPISADGHRLLESFGCGGKNTRIPLGVDIDTFCPDEPSRKQLRQAWKVTDETIIVAYFGRLVQGKGVHLLLQALIQLAAQPWMLVVDDFETDGSDYINEIDSLLKHPVFGGRLIRIHAKHVDIPRYMNAVDIVVVPSIRHGAFYEQYGRVVPESLACGAEVITSDSGSLPEVGGDVTRRFPAGSVPDLITTLSQSLQTPNSTRRQTLAVRQQWAIRHLSLQRQWQIMQPIFSHGY